MSSDPFSGAGAAGLALTQWGKLIEASSTNPTQFASSSPTTSPRQIILNNRYITFRGYGPDRQDQVSVLSGDEPPTIKGGYAKWTTVERPLRRGVSVFQGYDPVTMSVSLRFGRWDPGLGWLVDKDTGNAVEGDIETLEWMAGSNFVAGQSPFVYVNTYDSVGNTTNLVPYEYQQTAGWAGKMADASLWPWVIHGGITWGKSWREPVYASRVYQECTLSLMNWQGLTKPPQKSNKGGYFVSKPGRDTCLLIAEAPTSHSLYPQSLAQRIKTDHKNNPVTGSRLHLTDQSISYKIKHGLSIWVPAHQI